MHNETAARPCRVLLVDDHAVVREGLELLLAAQPDIEVVAQARNGHEGLALALSKRPDVVVLDVCMPDGGGIEAAQHMHEQCPEVRVLALTRHSDASYLRRVLRAGAAGYVVKRAAGDTLIGAIRTVAAGGTYVDPSLMGPLVAQVLGPVGDAARPRVRLSEREEQVLRLVAWGKANKEVAQTLGISVKTAEFYKASALEKLQIRTRTDILRHALAENWLAEEDDPD